MPLRPPAELYHHYAIVIVLEVIISFIYRSSKTVFLLDPKFCQKLPKDSLNILIFLLVLSKSNRKNSCRFDQHQMLLSMISMINIKLFSINQIEWIYLHLMLSFGFIVASLLQNCSWEIIDCLLCLH